MTWRPRETGNGVTGLFSIPTCRESEVHSLQLICSCVQLYIIQMNRVFRALAGTYGAVLHADDPSDMSVVLCEEHTLNIPTDPVNCRYWKEGQPDNWADNEDCGQVQGANDGRWNDETCSARRQYICKRSNRTYNLL